jgi:hypothetical protein
MLGYANNENTFLLKHFPVNSDVWDCSFHWNTIKPKLIDDLTSNQFNFQPLQKITKSNGGVIHLWTSIDSLVLKLLSLVLQRYLPSYKLCTHHKGHGGSKQYKLNCRIIPLYFERMLNRIMNRLITKYC